jgi:hypothetical protein
MEKIMIKTNDTSRMSRELRDSELDAISGGETYLPFKLTDVVVSSGTEAGPVAPLPKFQPPKYPGYP